MCKELPSVKNHNGRMGAEAHSAVSESTYANFIGACLVKEIQLEVREFSSLSDLSIGGDKVCYHIPYILTQTPVEN